MSLVEPRPLDPETTTLTMRPPRLSYFFLIKNNDMSEFFKRIFQGIAVLLNSYKCFYISVSSYLFRDCVRCVFSYSLFI